MEDLKSRLGKNEQVLSEVHTEVKGQSERLSHVENELDKARGNRESLHEVLDQLETSIDDLRATPLSDLAINAAKMQTNGQLQVQVNGGVASINSTIVHKEDSQYSFLC